MLDNAVRKRKSAAHCAYIDRAIEIHAFPAVLRPRPSAIRLADPGCEIACSNGCRCAQIIASGVSLKSAADAVSGKGCPPVEVPDVSFGDAFGEAFNADFNRTEEELCDRNDRRREVELAGSIDPRTE